LIKHEITDRNNLWPRWKSPVLSKRIIYGISWRNESNEAFDAPNISFTQILKDMKGIKGVISCVKATTESKKGEKEISFAWNARNRLVCFKSRSEKGTTRVDFPPTSQEERMRVVSQRV